MSVTKLDSNAVLVRRWFKEVWEERKPETIDELVTAESVCYAEQGPLTGPEEFKREVYYPMVAAFPDLKVTVDELLESGDNVVTRWSVRATHSSDALGFAATGRTVTFTGITWVRLRDGKFAEGWQSSNIPIVLQQLSRAVDV